MDKQEIKLGESLKMANIVADCVKCGVRHDLSDSRIVTHQGVGQEGEVALRSVPMCKKCAPRLELQNSLFATMFIITFVSFLIYLMMTLKKL